MPGLRHPKPPLPPQAFFISRNQILVNMSLGSQQFKETHAPYNCHLTKTFKGSIYLTQMPNLFLLVDTCQVPRYTQPRAKRPMEQSCLGTIHGLSIPHPLPPLLFSHAVSAFRGSQMCHWHPPCDAFCWPSRRGEGGPKGQALNPGHGLGHSETGQSLVRLGMRTVGRCLLPRRNFNSSRFLLPDFWQSPHHFFMLIMKKEKPSVNVQ